jgi:hypothetical protein
LLFDDELSVAADSSQVHVVLDAQGKHQERCQQ